MILGCLLAPSLTSAAALDTDRAASFLHALTDPAATFDEYLCPDDQALAQRLGISYIEAPCKPLIAWDLTLPQRERLSRTGPAGQFEIEALDEAHSRLVVFPGDSTLTRSWVFRDGRLVSSILYQARDWQQVDSTHFRFFISDPSLFHEANIVALEDFLCETAALLELFADDLQRLEREKIYYLFCRDQDEIRRLTGYPARGMYIVSHDLIVSTYSSHFHELAHLLINYKLQSPHLYTHPLLLEGFAVAVGGRGGKAPGVLQQLGLSLHRSGWVTWTELLDAQGFHQLNPSLSYPASAPVNRFLLEALGATEYLALYAGHGGDQQSVLTMKIDRNELPPGAQWSEYAADRKRCGAITPGADGLKEAGDPVAFQPLAGGEHLGFAVPAITLGRAGTPPGGYRSFLFEEFLDDASYGGERYLIRASAAEVGVYDLFTNTMIAHYASAFSSSGAEIPLLDGRFVFTVDQSAFPSYPAGLEYRFLIE